jgi:hypothetical protein
VRTPYVLPLLAACATIAVGCGSSSTDGGSSMATAAGGTTTAAAPSPGGPLGEVRQRLVAAGFRPETNEVSGTAVASLDVGTVTITAYADGADAVHDLRSIRQVFAETPDRGLVTRVGTRVYYVAAERPLTAADRARLAQIVAVAEATRQ